MSEPEPYSLHHTLRGYESPVNCVSFSPTGDFLATGSEDGSLRIWDPSNGKDLASLNVGSSILCIVWDPIRRKRLFFGCQNGTVAFLDNFGNSKVGVSVVAGSDQIEILWRHLPSLSRLELKEGKRMHFVLMVILVMWEYLSAQRSILRGRYPQTVRLLFHTIRYICFNSLSQAVTRLFQSSRSQGLFPKPHPILILGWERDHWRSSRVARG